MLILPKKIPPSQHLFPPNNNDVIIKTLYETLEPMQAGLKYCINQIDQVTNKIVELDKCCKDLNYKLQTR